MIISRITRARSSAPLSPVPLVYEAKDQVKRSYGLALTWASARDEDDARSQAKAQKASAYYFVPNAKQVAYTTQPDHAAYRRLHCAAATVLQKRGRETDFAAFYLLPSTIGYDTGFVWLVAARAGSIVIDEVLAREDAIVRATDFAADKSYEKIYGPEAILSGVTRERLQSVLQSGNDPMMRPARRAVDLTFGERFPSVPAEAAVLIAIVAAFVGGMSVYWGRAPDVLNIAGPERVVQKFVTLQNPVKAVPDPAHFLQICAQAAGELINRSNPLKAMATCTAPGGTAPTWTLSVSFGDSAMQALSATLTLPPHSLIGSAETGLPPEQVIAALTAAFAKANVTVTTGAARAPASTAPAPAATTARQGGLGATPPARGATPPGSSFGLAALQTPTADPTPPMRTLTTVTLKSSISPDYWSHRLKGLPLSITTVSRAASGEWTIAAQVL